MTRIEEIEKIMKQKDKDIIKTEPMPLNSEGEAVAEHCRFSFDLIDTPVDPKR